MTARAIVFGKLPRHGDFVARGLDAESRAIWDHFLSTRIESARLRLGERFEEAHDSGPPWRFVLGPGSFGSDWRAGVLAPSIDAAGRRFFVVAAVDGLSDEHAGPAIAARMESLIYEAFDGSWDVDTLHASVGNQWDGFENDEVASAQSDAWWVNDAEDERAFYSTYAPDDLLLASELAIGRVAA